MHINVMAVLRLNGRGRQSVWLCRGSASVRGATYHFVVLNTKAERRVGRGSKGGTFANEERIPVMINLREAPG